MIICDVCKAAAMWSHGPGPMGKTGHMDFCEEHVPRSYCSCNEDDYDELGRRNPCVDFVWIGPTEEPVPSPSEGEKT